MERQVARDSFVYHHSKCITIRGFRGTTVLEPEMLRIDELRAHPSGRTTLGIRARGQNVRGVRDDREKTEVCDTGVASIVDQDVRLDI